MAAISSLRLSLAPKQTANAAAYLNGNKFTFKRGNLYKKEISLPFSSFSLFDVVDVDDDDDDVRLTPAISI